MHTRADFPSRVHSCRSEMRVLFANAFYRQKLSPMPALLFGLAHWSPNTTLSSSHALLPDTTDTCKPHARLAPTRYHKASFLRYGNPVSLDVTDTSFLVQSARVFSFLLVH